MSGLAAPFEANQGQFAPEVAYAARTFAGTVFVTRDGKVVHVLAGKRKAEAAEQAATRLKLNDREQRIATSRGPGWALVESLQGASELTPVGSRRSATRVSRFAAGTAPNQTSSITTFDRVRLGEAWPGVSVELAARGNNVEKLFTVAPRTDPKVIQMKVAGSNSLQLGDDGSLIAATGNGNVAFTPPVAFQNIGGQLKDVPVRYVLLADNGYRFEITGGYDRSQPLVIDPLLQATYLGGSGGDVATALAIDAGGNVVVAGYTTLTNFPGTNGGAQPANGGGNDAFVARLSSDLGTLVQATYLGGSGYDQATALALDTSGNVFIAGISTSTNFPGTNGGAQPANGGGLYDAFVARLSSNLTTLVQATYLGGSATDRANALALDAGGNVLVTGFTGSIDFPGTTGGAQPAGDLYGDAFVARLSNNLATLIQATYLGGSFGDDAYALALGAGGKVFVAGFTNSIDFPGTIGGAQPAYGGTNGSYTRDGFIARLSSNLTTLEQATYLGGSGDEEPFALALDTGGNVFVAGYTNSTDFPGTIGGAQPAYGGGQDDAFVARLSNNLTTLMQATYLGGSGFDDAFALALDASGDVLVAGVTHSFDFPGIPGGAQPAYGGGFEDAFVARLSNDLVTLVQSTYLGGSDVDRAYAMALDAGGNVVVAGFTFSTDFPGTFGGAQSANGGGSDALVAKLTPDLKGPSDTIFANGFE